jgi:hypothetical protein
MTDMPKVARTYEEKVKELHNRHVQLTEWLRDEETSREGAHDWKAEVLRGRLEEIEWALELFEEGR